MFTARAMTRASSVKPVIAWIAMSAFARIRSGIASVGLNAIMFDSEQYD